MPKVPRPLPYAYGVQDGAYIGDRIVESTRSGRVRADSARSLHVAANISELFRSLEESSLAELPFLVGCGRITQTIDFLACQFRRFRSFVSSGPGPLSTREPQLHKPTDGFGAARLIGLSCRPGVDISRISDESRTAVTGSWPVAGRPLCFRTTCFLELFIIFVLR